MLLALIVACGCATQAHFDPQASSERLRTLTGTAPAGDIKVDDGLTTGDGTGIADTAGGGLNLQVK